jgi:hypothetical protein
MSAQTYYLAREEGKARSQKKSTNTLNSWFQMDATWKYSEGGTISGKTGSLLAMSCENKVIMSNFIFP